MKQVKRFINYIKTHPRTSFGSVILTAGLILWWRGKITTEQFLAIMAVAGTWLALDKEYRKKKTDEIQ